MVCSSVHSQCSLANPIQRPTSLAFPTSIPPMSTEQNRQIPKIQFRVLIIGRANAGKTSILQRVCDTTESPTIYRLRKYGGREKVRRPLRGPNLVCESDLTIDSSNLIHQWTLVILSTVLHIPLNKESARRAHHR